jgi:hypothetical protein
VGRVLLPPKFWVDDKNIALLVAECNLLLVGEQFLSCLFTGAPNGLDRKWLRTKANEGLTHTARPYRFGFFLGFDATAHACASDFERKESLGTGVSIRAAVALLEDGECSDDDPRWYDAVGSD